MKKLNYALATLIVTLLIAGLQTKAQTIDDNKDAKISTNVTKKVIMTDDDGVKKMTVTTVRNGEKEVLELEGKEVDEYLERSNEPGDRLCNTGSSNKMIFISKDGNGEQSDMEIDIDIDEIIKSAGLEMEGIDDDHQKVVIKTHCKNDSLKEKNCLFMYKAFGEDFDNIGATAGSYSYDFDVEEGGENKKMVIRCMGKEGKNEEKVMIIKTTEAYDDVENLDELFEKLQIDIDIEELNENGNKSKTVIVKKTVRIEEGKAEKTSGTKRQKGPNKPLEVSQFEFYPNPSNGRFTLDFEMTNKGAVEIEITDVNGKTVYKEAAKGKEKYSRQIDLSREARGIYFLNLRQGKRSINKKLIIE